MKFFEVLRKLPSNSDSQVSCSWYRIVFEIKTSVTPLDCTYVRRFAPSQSFVHCLVHFLMYIRMYISIPLRFFFMICALVLIFFSKLPQAYTSGNSVYQLTKLFLHLYVSRGTSIKLFVNQSFLMLTLDKHTKNYFSPYWWRCVQNWKFFLLFTFFQVCLVCFCALTVQ